MKKYILLYFLFVGMAAGTFAQQLGQMNMYVFKPAILNPAATGREISNDITLGYRQQWAGFTDAPKTFFLYAQYNANKRPPESFKPYSLRISDPSVYDKYQPSPKSKYNFFGSGFIFNDEHGFVTRTTAMLSLAVNRDFGDKNEYNLSAGLSFGINNLKYDLNSLTVLTSEADQTYNNFVAYNESTIYLDMNAGIWFDAPKFYIGYSALQIFGNKFPLGGSSSIYELLVHQYLMAGYKLTIGNDEDIEVVPGLLLGYGVGNLIKAANLKVVYKELYWGGITANENYAALMLGMNYKKLKIGYAFDMNLSGIRSYNAGSHEILLGIVL